MSSVDILSFVPCEFEAGTTVRFTDANAEYPSSAWTSVFVMNSGVSAATSIAGTVSGSGFAYVIPAATVITPGPYQWAFYYTATNPITEKARGRTGDLVVTPNLATTATPSQAQRMVTALETALLLFAGNSQQSVSFNGQSFSRANMGDYRNDLVFWKAQLIAEKRISDQRRGICNNNGRINVSFAAPTGSNPWCDTSCQ